MKSNDMSSVIKQFHNLTTGRINRMNKEVNREIDKRLHELGQAMVEKLKDYTQQWYSSYSPQDYERTGDLINSITYSVKGRTVRVIFDMRKFHTAKVNDGEGWQPHRGFDGIEFTYGLIDWIENGGNGGVLSNPRRDDGGIHMIENTQQWLDEYMDEQTKEIVNAVIRKPR